MMHLVGGRWMAIRACFSCVDLMNFCPNAMTRPTYEIYLNIRHSGYCIVALTYNLHSSGRLRLVATYTISLIYGPLTLTSINVRKQIRFASDQLAHVHWSKHAILDGQNHLMVDHQEKNNTKMGKSEAACSDKKENSKQYEREEDGMQ